MTKLQMYKSQHKNTSMKKTNFLQTDQPNSNAWQQIQKNSYKCIQSKQSTQINWINSARTQTAEPNKNTLTIQQRDRNNEENQIEKLSGKTLQ